MEDSRRSPLQLQTLAYLALGKSSDPLLEKKLRRYPMAKLRNSEISKLAEEDGFTLHLKIDLSWRNIQRLIEDRIRVIPGNLIGIRERASGLERILYLFPGAVQLKAIGYPAYAAYIKEHIRNLDAQKDKRWQTAGLLSTAQWTKWDKFFYKMARPDPGNEANMALVLIRIIASLNALEYVERNYTDW